ncbi:MAG: nucleotide-binding universal stress UspA family protein [Granulosicoccus sp.]|jgi:nucleotide-binding universal stress UspA family protein
MFKNIVAGFDGSPESENALRLACDLAQKYASEIHLVHTPQPQINAIAMGAVGGFPATTTLPPLADVEKACNRIVNSAKAIAQQKNINITQTYTELGDPADQIIACAENCNAELIVTGRRGLGSIGSFFQGSTTVRVNQLAKFACLSVV